MAEIKIHEQPIAYEVSVLPSGFVFYDADLYRITVELRGPDSWAVLWRTRALGADGKWDWEPIPSERTQAWLASHRFPLEHALELARAAAPHMTVNGMTAAQYASTLPAEEG